jgi:ADP-ribosylglycohydrolase
VTQKQRILGGLWGAVVGDALGVPVEFQNRAAVQANPVSGMRGFGTYNQPPGTWSDDSSMTLCTMENLLTTGFDAEDMGRRFVQWNVAEKWTPWGRVFDIGATTAEALHRIRRGAVAAQAGRADEMANGNGSLMRMLPVALWFTQSPEEELLDRVHACSAITHGHHRSKMCCGFFALVVRELVTGARPEAAFESALRRFLFHYDTPEWNPQFLNFQRLLDGKLAQLNESDIASSGYVVHTLEAALFCLLTTTSFTDCVLRAVNLGSDTDTTGCVAGGLAGLAYGVSAIPREWIAALARKGDLDCLIHEFADALKP